MSSTEHLAAMLPAAGKRLEVTPRPTPTPGPNEIVIDVEAVALNPVDYYQRENGFMVRPILLADLFHRPLTFSPSQVTHFPAVLGSDVAGTVRATGSAVPADAPFHAPGTRVAAFATAFYAGGAPDYGGLQKRVLVPASVVAPLPDAWSFEQGTLLTMAVATAFAGFHTLGVPPDTRFKAEDKKRLLVWGASSNVGTAVVQVAKYMGYRVYATASPKHHDMVRQLGAAHVFDRGAPDVVDQIVNAAKEDGVSMTQGYLAAGGPKESVEVLARLRGSEPATLASAPMVPKDLEPVEGVEVKFVLAPHDAEERSKHMAAVFNEWLPARLAKGDYVPSPAIRKMEGGLEKLNEALDVLKEGVSGEKLVLKI